MKTILILATILACTTAQAKMIRIDKGSVKDITIIEPTPCELDPNGDGYVRNVYGRLQLTLMNDQVIELWALGYTHDIIDINSRCSSAKSDAQKEIGALAQTLFAVHSGDLYYNPVLKQYRKRVIDILIATEPRYTSYSIHETAPTCP